jgi:hypothetical protein
LLLEVLQLLLMRQPLQGRMQAHTVGQCQCSCLQQLLLFWTLALQWSMWDCSSCNLP